MHIFFRERTDLGTDSELVLDRIGPSPVKLSHRSGRNMPYRLFRLMPLAHSSTKQ